MTFTLENTLTTFDYFIEAIENNKDYLSELDTPIGDGDHGYNMARGVKALQDKLEQEAPETVSDVFKIAALGLMGNIGGASGPLYGTAMLEMSKAAKDTQELLNIIEAGLAGIQKRGKAEAGDKTMVDVWDQIITAIKNNETLDESKIDTMVESTKEMKAKKGRASYLGDRSIGHIDPGSMSSGLFFKSLLKAGAL